MSSNLFADEDLCQHDEIKEDCRHCRVDRAIERYDNGVTKGGTVSADTDSMDQMVQAASIPNLATLFRRGKEAGLLKPTTGYGENA